MTPVDLVPFADRKKKLPKKMVSPVFISADAEPAWKILGAHLFDFWMIASVTTFMAIMFNLSISSLMTTDGLQSAFSPQSNLRFSFFMIPFVGLNYFFFSYFLNDGQSWGMHIFKKRIALGSKSFKESFQWAAHSLLLCLSFGLSFKLKRTQWANFKNHDYRYHDLVSFKESKVIDLLQKVEEFEAIEEVPEFDISRAA